MMSNQTLKTWMFFCTLVCLCFMVIGVSTDNIIMVCSFGFMMLYVLIIYIGMIILDEIEEVNNK